MIEVGMPRYEVFMSYVMENYVTENCHDMSYVCHDINYVLFHNTYYAHNLNIFVLVCKNIDIIIIFNDNDINNNVHLIYCPAV